MVNGRQKPAPTPRASLPGEPTISDRFRSQTLQSATAGNTPSSPAPGAVARIAAPGPSPEQDQQGARQESGALSEVIGRYALHQRIAAGGMGAVYLGSLSGAANFTRVVAIKRMHPQFAMDATFVARFRDEAWLSARLLHPNIVQTLDVVEFRGELLLVMEYVEGVTLRALQTDARSSTTALPLDVAAGVLVPVLHGLHAAHEAADDEGQPIGIVHRDFSPHNIIIGRDGHAKILDFGIARARTHQHFTSEGHVTGKCAYLSPEQVLGTALDRRTDIFAAGIVLWETLTGQRLFHEPGLPEAATILQVLNKTLPAPSESNPAVPRQVDEIVLRALQRNPEHRFASARELALALETAIVPATASTIAAFLSSVCAPRLQELAQGVARIRRLAVSARHRPPLTSEVPTEVSLPTGDESSADAASRSGPRPSRRYRRRWAVALFAPLAIFGFAVWAFSRSAASDRLPESSPRATGSTSSEPSPSISERSLGLNGHRVSAGIPEVKSAGPVPAKHSASVTHGPRQAARAPDGVMTASATGDTKSSGAREGSASARATPRSEARRADRPHGRTSAPAAHKNTTRAASSRCDPPTYLDTEGIRHFKEGCL